jgi:hypothetical protein
MQFVDELLKMILAAFAATLVPGATVDESDRVRLLSVRDDILAEAETMVPLPFEGDAMVEASALALATVANHEGSFSAGVQDCSACYIGSPICDHGHSITLYQLHDKSGTWGTFTREELCAENRYATRQALTHLRRGRSVSDVGRLFKVYARGTASGEVPTPAIEMATIFTRYIATVGIVVGYRNGALHASWRRSVKPGL